jgi:hypothetical protein
MKKPLFFICIMLALLLVGWIAGSLFPLPLWDHSDCHRLGGAVQTVEGPGKPTVCVIPWERY